MTEGRTREHRLEVRPSFFVFRFSFVVSLVAVIVVAGFFTQRDLKGGLFGDPFIPRFLPLFTSIEQDDRAKITSYVLDEAF